MVGTPWIREFGRLERLVSACRVGVGGQRLQAAVVSSTGRKRRPERKMKASTPAVAELERNPRGGKLPNNHENIGVHIPSITTIQNL
jgi:hypothetical protein